MKKLSVYTESYHYSNKFKFLDEQVYLQLGNKHLSYNSNINKPNTNSGFNDDKRNNK